MKKSFFTLIELIVVIAVLGILSAIIVPNISTMTNKATQASNQADMHSLQVAIDMYSLEKGDYPGIKTPTQLEATPLDFQKINPDYIRNLPKDKTQKYWVDYKGELWKSILEAPQVTNSSSGLVTWTAITNASGYKIYVLEPKTTSSMQNSTTLKLVTAVSSDILSYQGEIGKTYLVSALDKNKSETAPMGINNHEPHQNTLIGGNQGSVPNDGTGGNVTPPQPTNPTEDNNPPVQVTVPNVTVTQVTKLSDNTFKYDFTISSKVEKLEVYRTVSGKRVIIPISPTDTSYTDVITADLTNASQIDVGIKATNDLGNHTGKATIPLVNKLTLTSTTTTDQSIELQNTVNNATTVAVYRIEGDKETLVGTIAPNSKITDSDLTPNTTYTYKAIASNAFSTRTITDISVKTKLPLPTNVTITSTSSTSNYISFAVTYKNATKLELYRDGVFIKTIATNAVNAVDSGLQADTYYNHVLRAYNESGDYVDSAASNYRTKSDNIKNPVFTLNRAGGNYITFNVSGENYKKVVVTIPNAETYEFTSEEIAANNGIVTIKDLQFETYYSIRPKFHNTDYYSTITSFTVKTTNDKVDVK